MSKKVLNQILQPDPPSGPYFGRVSDPVEFMNSQVYAHEHVEGIVKDFLMLGATGSMVQSGFDHTLTTGLSVSIATGRAVKTDGLTYDVLPSQATVVTMATANPTLPRIDLVYLLLETNADANTEFKPFVQLRTQAQLEQMPPVDSYPPTPLNVPTEQHNKATVLVRTGTPNASPVAPSAGAGEVALYQVRVNAGVTTLQADKVTDVRSKVRSLFNAWAQIDVHNTSFTNIGETIDARVNGLVVVTPNTGLTKVYDNNANRLTLAGAAASGSAMGMMSAADKAKLDAATAAQTPNALVRRDASGDARLRALISDFGNVAGTALDIAGTTDNFPAYVQTLMRLVLNAVSLNTTGVLLDHSNKAGNNQDGSMLKIQAGQSGVHYTTSFKADGNAVLGRDLSVLGSFTAGSKSFLLDHPLDPENKDLVHAVVESHQNLLIYRVEAMIDSAEGAVEIDLDDALGFTQGTFKALCQTARVESAFLPSGGYVSAGDVVEGAADSMKVTITFVGPGVLGADAPVQVTIMAERKDALIMASQFVDGAGRLVPEHLKPAPTAEELALLDPLTVPVPPGDPRDGTDTPRHVSELVGKQGFPRYPALILGGGPEPLQTVNYDSADWEPIE